MCTHSGGKLKQHHDTTSSTSKVHEVKPPQAEMHLPNNNIVLSAASVAGIIHVTPFKKKENKIQITHFTNCIDYFWMDSKCSETSELFTFSEWFPYRLVCQTWGLPSKPENTKQYSVSTTGRVSAFLPTHGEDRPFLSAILAAPLMAAFMQTQSNWHYGQKHAM